MSTLRKGITKAKMLRTFLQSSGIKNYTSFFNFKCLHVLDLSDCGIKELPPSINKLKQLRYFDLSWNEIEVLPESITTLYNLQTLRINGCSNLKKIPKEMRKLINLRHLEIDHGEWNQMPSEIRQLSCLQTLPIFIVGQDKGCGIEELGCLNLGGELEIFKLENVRNATEARAANLKEKQNIHKLLLSWKPNRGEGGDAITDDEVLEGFQPHPNLRILEVHNFNGLKIPTWMFSDILFSSLVEINLCKCERWEHLPTLGHLPSLKRLQIKGMNSVKYIGGDFYHSNINQTEFVAFPSLESLTLSYMNNLVEWLEIPLITSFPRLKTLYIGSCKKLQVIPSQFPCLENLILWSCKGTALWSLSEKLTSLTFLRIDDCLELEFLLIGLLQSNSLLRFLCINECHDLTFIIPDLQGLQYLEHVYIVNCGKLKSLPDGLQNINTLRKLEIGRFSEDLISFPMGEGFLSLQTLKIIGWSTLTTLPEQLQYLTSLQSLSIYDFSGMVALPGWLGNLVSLQSLDIWRCKNLMYLPEEGMQRLTALQSLYIRDAPATLKERYDKERGEGWDKIAHISDVYI